MRAYVIEVKVDDSEFFEVGVIAESELMAKENIVGLFDRQRQVVKGFATVTVFPLKPAKIQRYNEGWSQFNASAALGKGYLFYTSGSYAFAARCKVIQESDGSFGCLMHRDDHRVWFA